MIYLDSAATTLQKPAEVRRAMMHAMETCGNPGRSGHKPAVEGDRILYACRREAAELFGLSRPEQIIFTQNATEALNIAINTVALAGDHGVISGYEHNSVVRPLESRKTCQVAYNVAFSRLFDCKNALEALKKEVRRDTAFVVYNAVSNVFGFRLPFWDVDAFCAARGIPLVLDFSQAAGGMEIDCRALKSRCFCCMPGHKGLYGPQGTGLLLCVNDIKPISFTQGGTGSNSLDLNQPDFLPDALESGTRNVPGIAGLLEGIRFVRRVGAETIGAHERALCRKTAEGLSVIPGVRAYAGPNQVGVLSFTARQWGSQELCERMGEQGICLRGGLHCAPLAHKSADTLPDGTVRISFSAFSTATEVERFLSCLDRVLKSC